MSSAFRLNTPLYITISGLIGAGKSTLAAALAKHTGLPLYLEPVEQNPYLELFYADKSKHAFAMQIYLLNERFRQQQEIIWAGKGAVQDRSIYEDCVFARMLTSSGIMSELDYNTYASLFTHMSNFMQRPTGIVYLSVSPEQALARIQARGRACESTITLDYLTQLHAAYKHFLVEIARTVPVLRIDYNQFTSTEEMTANIMQFHRDVVFTSRLVPPSDDDEN